MDYICKICGQQIENNGHFWREHCQKISDYFSQYEPRQTKDGQRVIFKKDIESYFLADFNDLKDRNSWLKSVDSETRKEYLLDLLVKRKLKKKWVYAPGQSLVRLSNLPSILLYEKEFEQNWLDICKKLGFKIKYKNKTKQIDWIEPIEVTQDTREQKPWVWPDHIKTNISKLDFGDYSLKDNTNLSLERKSLQDFCSSITSGNERFRKELNRVKKNNGYLIIIVESCFNDFRGLEYLPQMKHSKITFDHACKSARDLHEDFNCFQLVFCAGRKHAVKIAEFILKIGKDIKKIDLQYLIDSKLI